MNYATRLDPLSLLGKAAVGLRMGTLPREVVQHAKQHLLDTVGCLIAGYQIGISEAIRSYVVSQGGSPEATLLPGGQKTTASMVCLAHATYMFGLELSDYAPRGTVHPGNKVVPAALALAERGCCSGADMLAAIVAGYEIEIRMGRAVFQSAFYRGWWTPGMFGGIGPAVTAGHLLGLDAAGLKNTIGIVLNLLPTAMARVNDEGASIKWLMGGRPVQRVYSPRKWQRVAPRACAILWAAGCRSSPMNITPIGSLKVFRRMGHLRNGRC